jgi:hypothetical protein
MTHGNERDAVPTTLTAFRRSFARIRDEVHRQEVARAVITADEALARKRSLTAAQRRLRLAYRSICLEVVRTPQRSRLKLVGEHVDLAQREAWIHLDKHWKRDCEQVLVRWLRSRNPSLLSEAAWLVCARGEERRLPQVKRLVTHRHPRVVEAALRGAGMCTDRASPAYVAAILSLLTPFINGETYRKRKVELLAAGPAWRCVAIAAIDTVNRLDPDGAWDRFVHPSVLSPANPAAVCVLSCLERQTWGTPRRDQRTISPGLLWPLYEAANRDDYPEFDTGHSARQLLGLTLIHAAPTEARRVRTAIRELRKQGRVDALLKSAIDTALHRGR